jgi:serine protease Do
MVAFERHTPASAAAAARQSLPTILEQPNPSRDGGGKPSVSRGLAFEPGDRQAAERIADLMPVPSRRAHAVAAALLVVLAGSAATVTGADNGQGPVSRRNPIVQAIAKTKHAVVTVKVPRNGAKDAVGSGVVIDERGYIVTNRHVVGNAKTPRVHFHDGAVRDAEVVFAEAKWDLAVIKVRATEDLAALPLAPTDDLMVGESVIAVGHPYGYQNTVSVGIISALGREITMPTGEVLTDLIQTDASINPGNSGGPLLNVNGELIGITCALRDGAQGIAFGIKSGTVQSVLSKVLSAEHVAGVNHGLACVAKVVGETGDRQRVVVASFQGETLRQGDEILTVGAKNVGNAFDLERSLWSARPGQTVELKVQRAGKVMVVELTLAASNGAGHDARAERPAETETAVTVPRARIVGVSQ